MRVLLDTNVLLSMVIRSSRSLTILELMAAWHAGRFEVVASTQLLEEFVRVLAKRKFVKHLLLSEEADVLAARVREALKVAASPAPACRSYPSLRDPDDAMVLAAAEHFRPDAIVTGDQDLLALGEFEGIPILSPRELLDWLSA